MRDVELPIWWYPNPRIHGKPKMTELSLVFYGTYLHGPILNVVGYG